MVNKKNLILILIFLLGSQLTFGYSEYKTKQVFFFDYITGQNLNVQHQGYFNFPSDIESLSIGNFIITYTPFPAWDNVFMFNYFETHNVFINFYDDFGNLKFQYSFNLNDALNINSPSEFSTKVNVIFSGYDYSDYCYPPYPCNFYKLYFGPIKIDNLNLKNIKKIIYYFAKPDGSDTYGGLIDISEWMFTGIKTYYLDITFPKNITLNLLTYDNSIKFKFSRPLGYSILYSIDLGLYDIDKNQYIFGFSLLTNTSTDLTGELTIKDIDIKTPIENSGSANFRLELTTNFYDATNNKTFSMTDFSIFDVAGGISVIVPDFNFINFYKKFNVFATPTPFFAEIGGFIDDIFNTFSLGNIQLAKTDILNNAENFASSTNELIANIKGLSNVPFFGLLFIVFIILISFLIIGLIIKFINVLKP